MRNTFFKDSLRQVKWTLNRFLSILAITALGVAFYAGLKATAPDMRMTAQSYFSKLHFMDLDLLSTGGFTQDDVAAIKAVKGIGSVMPTRSADALVDEKDKSLTVKLLSLDIDKLKSDPAALLNRPELTQGRMPQNSKEILADPRYLMLTGGKVGDKVTFTSGTGGSLKGTLYSDTFTIVGVAQDPLYISYERGSSTIGSGRVDAYFILPSSAFSLDVYTEVYLTVANPKGLSRFDKGYDDLIAPVSKALTSISGAREQARYAEIRAQAEKQLDDAQRQLDEGQAALDNAAKQLDDAQAQIDNGESALTQGRETLKTQIASAQKQLDEGRAAYEAGETQYEQNLADYQRGLGQYQDAQAKLETAKNRNSVGGLTDAQLQSQIETINAAINALKQNDPNYPNNPQYQKLQGQLSGLSALLTSQQQLEAQKTVLAQSAAQLDAAKRTLADNQAQLDEKQAELNAQQTAGEQTLADKQEQLNAAKSQLEAGRSAYEQQQAQAQPKLDAASLAITQGQKQLASLKKPVWYVLDHNTNPGFVGFKQDADRIDAIANVFPLIFFLVAALVSLTTMTRLVEDDRMTIGTMKALGYGRGVIAARYLLYAVAASLIGSGVGLVSGYNLFPRVVFNAYRILYTLPSVMAPFNVPYAVLSTLAAVLCAALPAYLVCIRSLQSAPAELMRPKAPQSGKRILLERFALLWKHMTFSQKVAARNLFRYKKRLFMTIIGVAGCTALVFTGFGLQDSISTIVGRQYEEIRRYDMEVDTREGASAAQMDALSKALASGGVTGSIAIRQQSLDALSGNKVKSIYLVVPQNTQELRTMIDLRERVGKRPLTLSDNAVIISEKLASLYGIKKGGTLRLRNTDGVERSVKVSGIAENYVFHYVYMSPVLYQKLFGVPFVANQRLCELSSTSKSAEDGLSKTLMKLDAVSSVTVTSTLRTNFAKMIGALKYVVLVLILSAAALAFVVLFSLTSINIDERNRELATIKVLGFYNGELAAYVYRENVVLTLLGALIGLVLGIFMQRFVIITAEVDLVMFSRDILFTTYLYSFGLTVVFAALVNAIMFRHIRRIDMVSSLKSLE